MKLLKTTATNYIHRNFFMLFSLKTQQKQHPDNTLAL